jgi:hypothetical protein
MYSTIVYYSRHSNKFFRNKFLPTLAQIAVKQNQKRYQLSYIDIEIYVPSPSSFFNPLQS